MSFHVIPRALPTAVAAMILLGGSPAAAQQPRPATPAAAASSPTERLRAVLPADVAERVIATVAAARARELPAEALELRALKFASRGEAPAAIERAVAEHAERMSAARASLATARPARPSGDEIAAGAEALRQGVDGRAIGELARSAPSGRSLAVPLYVLGELAARGLPSDQALARVGERLAARATDSELEQLPVAAAGRRPGGEPGDVGRDVRQTRRPAGVGGPGGAAGGRPASVPANGGRDARPATPPRPPAGRPATPPGSQP